MERCWSGGFPWIGIGNSSILALAAQEFQIQFVSAICQIVILRCSTCRRRPFQRISAICNGAEAGTAPGACLVGSSKGTNGHTGMKIRDIRVSKRVDEDTVRECR